VVGYAPFRGSGIQRPSTLLRCACEPARVEKEERLVGDRDMAGRKVVSESCGEAASFDVLSAARKHRCNTSMTLKSRKSHLKRYDCKCRGNERRMVRERKTAFFGEGTVPVGGQSAPELLVTASFFAVLK
jgi:hypothetical protein